MQQCDGKLCTCLSSWESLPSSRRGLGGHCKGVCSDAKAKVCAPTRRQTLHLPSGWESSPSGVFTCYCAGTAIVVGSSANVRPGLDVLCKSASYARPTPIPTRMVLTMWSLVRPFEHGNTIHEAGSVDVLARQATSMHWRRRSAGSSEQHPMVS